MDRVLRDESISGIPLGPAAQYIRMSTEHQKYSIENQQAAIEAYACLNGIEIIRTYVDRGKSGLLLQGRTALKQLIADVSSGNANFKCILVFDVSRWDAFRMQTRAHITNSYAEILRSTFDTAPSRL